MRIIDFQIEGISNNILNDTCNKALLLDLEGFNSCQYTIHHPMSEFGGTLTVISENHSIEYLEQRIISITLLTDQQLIAAKGISTLKPVSILLTDYHEFMGIRRKIFASYSFHVILPSTYLKNERNDYPCDAYVTGIFVVYDLLPILPVMKEVACSISIPKLDMGMNTEPIEETAQLPDYKVPSRPQSPARKSILLNDSDILIDATEAINQHVAYHRGPLRHYIEVEPTLPAKQQHTAEYIPNYLSVSHLYNSSDRLKESVDRKARDCDWKLFACANSLCISHNVAVTTNQHNCRCVACAMKMLLLSHSKPNPVKNGASHASHASRSPSDQQFNATQGNQHTVTQYVSSTGRSTKKTSRKAPLPPRQKSAMRSSESQFKKAEKIVEPRKVSHRADSTRQSVRNRTSSSTFSSDMMHRSRLREVMLQALPTSALPSGATMRQDALQGRVCPPSWSCPPPSSKVSAVSASDLLQEQGPSSPVWHLHGSTSPAPARREHVEVAAHGGKRVNVFTNFGTKLDEVREYKSPYFEVSNGDTVIYLER